MPDTTTVQPTQDAQNPQTQPSTGVFQPQEPPGQPENFELPPEADPLAENVAVAEGTVKAIDAGAESKPATDDRPRDSQGRFLPKAEPTAPTPTVSKLWQVAAEQVGLTPEAVAAFKSDTEAQQAVEFKRFQAIRSAGVDPQELALFRQWKQAAMQQPPAPAATPAPAQQPTVATTIDDLNLKVDEDALGPEAAAQMKALVAYINKLTPAFNQVVQQNQTLGQKMTGLESQLQQSAAARAEADRTARFASEWDQAVSGIEHWEDLMGKPSELARMAQQNRMDPRLLNSIAFDQYFAPVWERWAGTVGESPQTLAYAIQEAWEMSPFSKMQVNGNGKSNGKPKLGAGSVVRSTPRRSNEAPPGTSTNDVQAEFQRISETVAQAWEDAGGNPFRSD